MAAYFSSEIRKCLGAAVVVAVALWLEPSAARVQWLTIAAVGGLWLAFPPSARLPAIWRGITAALLGLPLLVLLPLGAWDTDLWRNQLAQTGNVFPLLTPQPWLMLLTLAGYAAAIAFAVWLFLAEWSERQRRALTWCLGGLALVVAGGIVGRLALGIAPSAFIESGLGPFPSRNQGGLFFALAALWWLFLAGQARREQRVIRGVGCALAAVICAGLTVANGSRAGMGFLGIGLILQCALGGWGMARSRRLLLAGLLVVIAGFVFWEIRDLPAFRRDGGTNVSFRQAVQTDTLDLIRDSPLVGIGLGNYDAVFVFYRTRSASEYRVAHAENDWLHAAAETGIPTALLLAAIWVGLLTQIGRRWRRDPSPRTVTIALILLLFAIHLVFDQSGHAPGILFWLLLMVSLPFSVPEAGRVPRWRGRWIGGVLIMIALVLRFWGVPREAPVVRAEGVNFFPGERPNLAELADALAIRPLSWSLHEMRAHQFARVGQWDDAAVEFQWAETLEPFSTALAQREIQAFRRGPYPARTAAAVEELLRRSPVEARPAFLDTYLEDAAEAAGEAEAEWLDFRVIRWRRLDDSALREQIARLTPPPGRLTPYAEAKLAGLAIRVGGLDQLAKLAERMDGFRPATWRKAADTLAAGGDWRGADWIILHYLLPDFPETASLEERLREWQAAPADPVAAFALARAYLQRGSASAARRVIDRVPIRGETLGMAGLYRGWADYLDGKYQAAWEHLKQAPLRGGCE